MLATALSVLIALSGAGPQAAAQAAEAAGIPVLVCEYEDGRITYHTIKDGKGFWTVRFPKLGDPPPQKGEQLSALDMRYRRDGDALVVSVSLHYGSAHQLILPVKEIRVGRDQKVRVEELSPFGVAPVTLSVVRRASNALPVPQVESASTALAVDVQTPSDTEPQYKIRLRNLSARPLLLIYVESRIAEKPMTGYQRGPRGTALVDGGRETTFELPVLGSTPAFADGTWAPQPIDKIMVKTAVWADGTVEGDRDPLLRDQVAAAGRTVQLKRAIAILDDAIKEEGRGGVHAVADAIGKLDIVPPPALVADIRGRLRPDAGSRPITVESGFRAGMQHVKESILGDLKDVPAAQMTASLMSLREQYAAWLQRMQQLQAF
jgi:hypothetical protein